MASKYLIPEPIRRQMDQTKYYVPSDDDPTAQGIKKMGGIAYQDQSDPGAVAVVDPHAEDMQAVLGHEAYHGMVANMPPSERAKIPQDDYSDVAKAYDVRDQGKWRAAGLTITQIPQEKAAKIIEYYIKGTPETRRRLQPWIDDLNAMKQSTVEPNRPGMMDINTAVRPPAGGQGILEQLGRQGIKPAMPEKDPIDEFIALPRVQQLSTLRSLSPEKQDKLLGKIKERRSASKGESGSAGTQPEERTLGNYADEGVSGIGRGLKNDVAGLYQTIRHPVDTAEGVMKQANESGEAAGKEFRDLKGVPLGQRLGATALAGLEKAPLIGGMVQHAEQGGERMASPEGFGAAMEGITSFAAPEVAGKAIGVASHAPDVWQRSVRAVTGTGAKTVRDLVKETKAVNDAKVAQYGEDLKGARTEGEASPAAKKFAYKRGIERLDAKVKEDLQATEKQVNAEGNKKYAELGKVLKDQKAGLHQALDEEGHVKGEPVPLVHYLSDTVDAPLRGSETKTAIGTSLKNRIEKGDLDLNYNDLQGYREELGRELRKGSLAPDVFTAYKNTFNAVDDAMQKIADRNGLGKQQAAARNYWRQYAQTFLDRGSPIRKALDSKERGQTVDAFRGADQSGIQALARFNPELAQRINTVRGYAEQADQVKGTEPTVPERPTGFKRIGPEDLKAAKQKGIEGRQRLVEHKAAWMAIGPAFYLMHDILRGEIPSAGGTAASIAAPLAIQAVVTRVLSSPKVVEFLTKATPADVAQIPPELRGNFPRILTEAQKRGIKVSPALTKAFTGAALAGQTLNIGTSEGNSGPPPQ